MTGAGTRMGGVKRRLGMYLEGRTERFADMLGVEHGRGSRG